MIQWKKQLQFITHRNEVSLVCEWSIQVTKWDVHLSWSRKLLDSSTQSTVTHKPSRSLRRPNDEKSSTLDSSLKWIVGKSRKRRQKEWTDVNLTTGHWADKIIQEACLIASPPFSRTQTWWSENSKGSQYPLPPYKCGEYRQFDNKRQVPIETKRMDATNMTMLFFFASALLTIFLHFWITTVLISLKQWKETLWKERPIEWKRSKFAMVVAWTLHTCMWCDRGGRYDVRFWRCRDGWRREANPIR